MKTLTAVLLLVPTLALAQTTQPVYVRPSKGKVIATSIPANSTDFAAPVLDFTAFQAMQISIQCPAGVACDGAGRTATVTVKGSTTPAANFTVESDPNAVFFCDFDSNSNICRYQISNPSSYIKVFVTTTAPTAITLEVTPIPFSARMAVNGVYQVNDVISGNPGDIAPVLIGGLGGSGGQLAVETTDGSFGALSVKIKATTGETGSVNITNAVGGTLVLSASSASVIARNPMSRFLIQNQSTVPIACGFIASDSDPVDFTSAFTFVLAAGTAAKNGTGGTQQLSGWIGGLKCISTGAGPYLVTYAIY